MPRTDMEQLPWVMPRTMTRDDYCGPQEPHVEGAHEGDFSRKSQMNAKLFVE